MLTPYPAPPPAGGTNAEYKSKFRSLHFNLKDPANPELRARVLHGEVAPAALVRRPAALHLLRFSKGMLRSTCRTQFWCLETRILDRSIYIARSPFRRRYAAKHSTPHRWPQVRLSPGELASRELSEWRRRKAQELDKHKVLDAETAAKFSTAAAAELSSARSAEVCCCKAAGAAARPLCSSLRPYS